MRHTMDGARQPPGSQRLGRQAVRHPHMFGDPTIADAVLDRLVHSAHRLELKGESLRKLRAAKNIKLDEVTAN